MLWPGDMLEFRLPAVVDVRATAQNAPQNPPTT
jgi:hypothetical protein